jgi:hypothetical protein
MNVKLRTYITGFGVALGIAFAPTSQAEQINIRVYVVDDANLPEIRTTLMERGAVVRDFLPEGAFAATVDSSVAPLLAEIAGVLGTEAVTAPSAPRRMAVAGVPPLQPAGVKLLPPDQVLQRDTAAKVQPITSVAPSMFGRRRALALGGTTRPSKADNSLSVYFPPIGDQDGRPSCAAWAACYYWSTYTQARDEDVSLAGVTWLGKDERIPPCPNAYNADGSWNDAEYQICAKATNYTWIPPRPSGLTGHIASPAFLYPLINHGVAGPPGGGTYYTMGEVMQFLNRVGCGSWAKWPYDDWVPDGERWPSEDQWIEALGRRTQQTHSIDLSTTSGLDALRQVLVNGDIVITSGPLYQNWFNFWDPSCQSNGTCKGIDNDVYFASDGKAYDGHAVTVVGYDDDKAYTDLNGVTHHGALLMANSASPDYGTYNSTGSSAVPGPDPKARGFIWMAYDYARSSWPMMYYNVDRPQYRPKLYAASGLSAVERLDITFSGGTGPATHPRFNGPRVLEASWFFNNHSIDASKRVVIDLTDGLGTVDFAKPFVPLFVELGSCNWLGAPGCGAGLQNTTFFYDPAGDGRNVTTLISPDPAKVLTTVRPGTKACTFVPPTGDVDDSRRVDRTDVQLIVNTVGQRADCMSDPRDLNSDDTISVMDARLDVLRCGKPGCAP